MDSQQIVRAIKFYEKKEEEIKILNVKKEMIDSEIKSKLSIIEKLTRQEEDTKRAADVIQECLNVFNEQYLNRIKKLLNAALKFVFFDQDYEFVFELKNKEIEFTIMDHQKNLQKPLSKLGGGIRVVISTFLQIFFITERKNQKILLLDESLYAISEKYREKFYTFLKTHSKENSFHILIISHDETANKYMEHIVEIN